MKLFDRFDNISRTNIQYEMQKTSILFQNGKIYTPNGLEEWMIIEDNRIFQIGSGPVEWSGETVDLEGKLVLPGLQDSHIHVHSLGRFSYRLNLRKVGSIEKLQSKLEEYVKNNGDQWIIGGGWDQDYMENQRYPTRHDLDPIVDNKPVVLYRGCNHIAVLNTKAIEILQLDENSSDPEGGKIDRGNDGFPTGILRENALDLVAPYVKKQDENKHDEYFKEGLEQCLQFGLTGVQTNDKSAWQYYKKLAEEDQLPIRVFLTVPADELGDPETPDPNEQVGLLTAKRVKLFADGSLGAETAALRDPYLGSENRGMLLHPPEKLKKKIKKAHNSGFQLEVHAIGDRGAEVVIDGFKEAGATKEDRPILTHCQVLDEDLVKRMRENGIVANIQPPFVNTDAKWAEKRLGEGRLDYAYAWKTLLENGIHCAGGSDAPIETADPFYGMYTAIKRLDPDGNEWLKDQQLTIHEAISLYSEGSAYAVDREDKLGRIAEGFLADFVIVEPDILDNPKKLLEDPVHEVWVDGQQQYHNLRTNE